MSPEMFVKLKASHDWVNSMRFLDMSKNKTKKIRSICLENEPILEELEEYLVPEMDNKNHRFVLPCKNRTGSVDFATMTETKLPSISEKKEEKEDDTG